MEYPKSAFSFLVLSVSAFFFVQAASAAPTLNHYTIRETLPDGNVKIRIIEEDPSLRDQPTQISQRVISTQIVPASQADSVLKTQFTALLTTESPRTPTAPGRPLWVPTKNAWTQADEDTYSQWYATQVGQDFDTGTGLLADCADMGLLFRWVYARNNHLPIANTMTGSGKLFGHFSGSSDWDKLATDPDWKKDERFKAALRYLFGNTYTQTLMIDLYPTLVNPQYVRPGSLFMIIRPTDGHTQTIKTVDPNNGITTYWGNEPAAETIYASGIIVEFQNKLTFGMWRQPKLVGTQWTLIPSAEMPGYSLEQFQQNFSTSDQYQDWFEQRLGIHETDQSRLSIFVDAFIQAVQSRLALTAGALPVCVFTPCAVNGSIYNDYSSFARDARLTSDQQTIATLMAKLGPQDQTVQSLQQEINGYGEVILGTGLTYANLIQDPSVLAKLNSDPRVSFAARWGIQAPTGMAPTTFDFLTNSQALKALLDQRVNEIFSAESICESGKCDPTNASLKVLNTAQLDVGIREVMASVLKSTQDAQFDKSILTEVQTQFNGSNLNYISGPTCANTQSCTYSDAVFAADSLTRAAQWSSDPTVSANVRWDR